MMVAVLRLFDYIYPGVLSAKSSKCQNRKFQTNAIHKPITMHQTKNTITRSDLNNFVTSLTILDDIVDGLNCNNIF